jgi:hypothetical protein
MIVNAIAGVGVAVPFLFSCDYAGKVVKSQVDGNELKELDSVTTGSGSANCIAVENATTIYVGSGDGTVKKIEF